MVKVVAIFVKSRFRLLCIYNIDFTQPILAKLLEYIITKTMSLFYIIHLTSVLHMPGLEKCFLMFCSMILPIYSLLI